MPKEFDIDGGTSASAAHVTASLALIKAYLKTLYPNEPNYPSHQTVIRLLLDGADQPPALQGIIREGRRLNLYSSLIQVLFEN